jgi:hypothetical protein
MTAVLYRFAMIKPDSNLKNLIVAKIIVGAILKTLEERE